MTTGSEMRGPTADQVIICYAEDPGLGELFALGFHMIGCWPVYIPSLGSAPVKVALRRDSPLGQRPGWWERDRATPLSPWPDVPNLKLRNEEE
jgi:hypothetical protein